MTQGFITLKIFKFREHKHTAMVTTTEAGPHTSRFDTSMLIF